MPEKLERSISLMGAVGVIVGFVVGGSIFVLIPSLAGMTGPSLYLAYACSALPALFAALYLIQPGSALPVTGANYIAITRWVSPVAGFTSSLAVCIGIICTNCLVAWGFGEYLSVYFPQIPVIVYAVLVILFLSLINWLGVGVFEKIQVAMMAIFILAMLIFGIGGCLNMDPGLHTELFPKGMGAFITVVAIASFSWGGVIAVVEVAGEVKNPKKNLPRSIIISMIIIGTLYVLQTYALTGNLLWSEASALGSTAILTAAATFLPQWGVNFLALGALLAMATTVNAMILMGAREIFAWSNDKLIPEVFMRIHPKYKTPEMTIFLITLLSIIGVLFSADLEKYALMVVFGLMVIQLLGAFAVFRMPKVAPEVFARAGIQFSPFWRGFTWIGCFIVFLGIFIFGFLADYVTGFVFLGIWLSSILYWFVRKKYLERQGIKISDTLRQKLPQTSHTET
ncbi:MAG: amino acid permease [Desulfobacter sp.]|nr:amino acid permease [Desulfobacter sp.]